ncbi:MAG: single-stranded DNA-binding protein [Acholeplasmatales bacterium]|nr:single-stranded DNA-binding protein [Acholeplasmatales bacterium]
MYNYVMLMGRLCTEPDVKTSASGVDYTNLLLAVSRPFKNPDTNKYDTDFFPIAVFSSLCDICKQNLHKGDCVAIKARLERANSKIESKEITQTNIVAERIMFISHSNKN